MRRGRRDPPTVRVGDALDFWRVEAVEPDSPAASARRDEGSRPGMAAVPGPRAGGRPHAGLADRVLRAEGPLGLVYWYALYPIHQLIFSGMIRRLAERASGGA